jgi:16S rRNA G527 N7-methylase RsmG
MIDLNKKAQEFLNGLSSEDSRTTFEALSSLAENLETKNDPDPVEIRLVANIYEFIERLKILESNMKSYVKDSRKDLSGNKLESLYEEYSSRRIFSLE